jgi:hypothetical protein
LVDATKYRILVGSLRYQVNTRPDLTFAVGYVNKYMEEPHEEHLAAIKHILRFIAGTRLQGVFYPRKEEGARLIAIVTVIWSVIWTSKRILQVLCSFLEIALLAGNH